MAFDFDYSTGRNHRRRGQALPTATAALAAKREHSSNHGLSPDAYLVSFVIAASLSRREGSLFSQIDEAISAYEKVA